MVRGQTSLLCLKIRSLSETWLVVPELRVLVLQQLPVQRSVHICNIDGVLARLWRWRPQLPIERLSILVDELGVTSQKLLRTLVFLLN